MAARVDQRTQSGRSGVVAADEKEQRGKQDPEG